MSAHDLRGYVELNAGLSVSEQCDLLSLPRSSYYYEPCGESAVNLELMRIMDKLHTDYPFMGVEGLLLWVNRHHGGPYNVKRIRRLMRLMDLVAIYPAPRTSTPGPDHKIYPYLLRDLSITKPNQVWCADITYLPMEHGFMYLVAIMDWFSRFVLAWEISNTMHVQFCVETLQRALTQFGAPEYSNTDQGSQFTSHDYLTPLLQRNVRISMDGRGRALDNVFIERLWRSVKYEDVYLHAYETGYQLFQGLKKYFHFYNRQRLHQGLTGQTPHEVYHAR
jgi:putative transposase